MPTSPAVQLVGLYVGIFPIKAEWVEVEPDVTVLVGRNGSGKSWYLEGAMEGANFAARGVSGLDCRSGVYRYYFRVSEGEIRTLYLYEFAVERLGYREARVFRERLDRFNDQGEPSGVWNLEGGTASLGERTVTLGPGVGVMASPDLLPEEAKPIRHYLLSVRFVRAGSPRATSRHTPTFLCYSEQVAGGDEIASYLDSDAAAARAKPPAEYGPWEGSYQEPRLAALATRMCQLFEQDAAQLDDVRSMLGRLGLPADLSVDIALPSENGTKFGVVRLGGTDIGALSDGTLRVLEVVSHLCDPECSLLIVEHPESDLHPGLTRRVLAELDAFASERQLLLSTHDHRVVSWARANQVRLVSWAEGPHVTKLSGDVLDRLEAFLNDEGDLGEFLFEGGADA